MHPGLICQTGLDVQKLEETWQMLPSSPELRKVAPACFCPIFNEKCYFVAPWVLQLHCTVAAGTVRRVMLLVPKWIFHSCSISG